MRLGSKGLSGHSWRCNCCDEWERSRLDWVRVPTYDGELAVAVEQYGVLDVDIEEPESAFGGAGESAGDGDPYDDGEGEWGRYSAANAPAVCRDASGRGDASGFT